MNHDDLRYHRGMFRWRACVFALACATNCTKANPGATCSDGTCTDPAFPYCDSDGSVGGTPGECIAVSCTPSEIMHCRGSQAFTCNANGNGYELDDCTLGCSDGPPAHCKYLQPTYMPDVCDTPAQQATISFTGSGTFDPNLDTNCTGGVLTQTGADDVCVVHYGSIDVAADAAVTVIGASTGGRAIAFVADQGLSIEGTVDVSAHIGVNGPGGGVFSSGASPREDATQSPALLYAGGGAGGATAGGAGGMNNVNGVGADCGTANAGSAAMNPATLSVLVGGAATPIPLPSDPPNPVNARFGGGGGALELVSCHGTVDVSGTISAGGGGGGGGFVPLVIVSGYGGGAGGVVVVEGTDVKLSGEFYANGGAGGGGCQFGSGGNFSGPNGADGSLSDSTPAVGASLAGGDGTGGNGGYKGGPPTNGTHASIPNFCPGGGGGSVGFFQTYTPTGVTPTLTPAHASPAFQPNGTVQTR
jgi:hypothetical protein